MPDPISWEFAWPYLLGALIGGYLLGSLPFGLLLTRIAGLGDIRSIGSGNIGATNVLRTGRKGLAAATLLLDAAKGAVAVLIAQRLGGPDAALMAGLGAVLGHMFPVWLKFRGGKGMATVLGVLLTLSFFCRGRLLRRLAAGRPAQPLFLAFFDALGSLFRAARLADRR